MAGVIQGANSNLNLGIPSQGDLNNDEIIENNLGSVSLKTEYGIAELDLLEQNGQFSLLDGAGNEYGIDLADINSEGFALENSDNTEIGRLNLNDTIGTNAIEMNISEGFISTLESSHNIAIENDLEPIDLDVFFDNPKNTAFSKSQTFVSKKKDPGVELGDYPLEFIEEKKGNYLFRISANADAVAGSPSFFGKTKDVNSFVFADILKEKSSEIISSTISIENPQSPVFDTPAGAYLDLSAVLPEGMNNPKVFLPMRSAESGKLTPVELEQIGSSNIFQLPESDQFANILNASEGDVLRVSDNTVNIFNSTQIGNLYGLTLS